MNENQQEENNKFSVNSKKKWFYIGLAITLVNPVFSGLIIGAAFLSEPELKKYGRIIITIAVLWGVVVLFLSRWLMKQGYFVN
ncbi:MAG: hypothetical protein ABH887_00235 [bacterium]